jgi:hypothetical protein
MPSVSPPSGPTAEASSPAARWRAARQQATGIVDWTHPQSIGGRGPAGEVTGERRRRSTGGAPAGTRTTVREGVGLNHVLHEELP